MFSFNNKDKRIFNKEYKECKNELNSKWKDYINDDSLNWADKSLRLKNYLKFKALWNEYIQGYIKKFGLDFDFKELENEFESKFLKQLNS